MPSIVRDPNDFQSIIGAVQIYAANDTGRCSSSAGRQRPLVGPMP